MQGFHLKNYHLVPNLIYVCLFYTELYRTQFLIFLFRILIDWLLRKNIEIIKMLIKSFFKRFNVDFKIKKI